jgi:two-component system, OmpR family, sensor histidine kinase CiaH
LFQSARLKLTAWYLLIIMLISISFSMVIYRALTSEFHRVLKIEAMRQKGLWVPHNELFTIPLSPNDPVPARGVIIASPNLEVISDAQNRLKNFLLLLNLGILGVSGAAGYFLAGRTLKPIKEMVDEQNRFITDASHELRTPLTSLRSEIEVGLRDKKLDLKNAKKLLFSNLEEVNNLQYLSDNLIKLAQNQNTNGNQFYEKILLKEIINEALKKVAKLSKNKKITIKDETQSFTLFGEKQSLIELFVILLDNGIKYSSVGTIINLTSEKTKEFVSIKVADQGPGISKEDLPNLFERFYRADKSRAKSEISGYGLGLSIAKQIVEKHHGTIKVESELGKGSHFLINLPVKH